MKSKTFVKCCNLPPTPRQREVLEYIIDYKRDNGGDSPTQREIMDELYLATTSAVAHHLKQLEMRGLISRPHGRARCIAVPGGRWVYDPQETA